MSKRLEGLTLGWWKQSKDTEFSGLGSNVLESAAYLPQPFVWQTLSANLQEECTTRSCLSWIWGGRPRRRGCNPPWRQCQMKIKEQLQYTEWRTGIQQKPEIKPWGYQENKEPPQKLQGNWGAHWFSRKTWDGVSRWVYVDLSAVSTS